MKMVFHSLEYSEVRKMILESQSRADGRGPGDIRPITCEVGVLPRTHGSALFTRGETQSLAVATLGTTTMNSGLMPWKGSISGPLCSITISLRLVWEKLGR